MFCKFNKENRMEQKSAKMHPLEWKEQGLSLSPIIAPSLDNQPDISLMPKTKASSNENLPLFIFVKVLDKHCDPKKIKGQLKALKSFQGTVDVINSLNFYAKFTSYEDACEVLKQHQNESQFQLTLMTKLPLDFNLQSKIVLVTFFNEQVELSLDLLHREFSKFGKIAKMVLFQKKNNQVFIEFVLPQEASRFKNTLHNTQHKKMFFLKVQFTQKTHLRIMTNSLFEKNYLSSKKKEHLSLQDSSCEEEGSFILLLKQLSPEVKHKCLFNLFSIYGVILKIGINRDSASGFIVFAHQKSIEEAIASLQGESLFGQSISLEQQETVQEEGFETMNYIRENKSQGRFDRPKKGLKPSNILYIYNLNHHFDLQAVKNSFQTIEEVTLIKYTEDNCSSG